MNSCASVCNNGNIDERCIVQMHNTTSYERCIAGHTEVTRKSFVKCLLLGEVISIGWFLRWW